jgi:hypothetical protein
MGQAQGLVTYSRRHGGTMRPAAQQCLSSRAAGPWSCSSSHRRRSSSWGHLSGEHVLRPAGGGLSQHLRDYQRGAQ